MAPKRNTRSTKAVKMPRSTTKSKKKLAFDFLGLPRELRDMIYVLYMGSFGHDYDLEHHNPGFRKKALIRRVKFRRHGLVAVNKQVSAEYSELIAKVIQFRFNVHQHGRWPLATWPVSPIIHAQITTCSFWITGCDFEQDGALEVFGVFILDNFKRFIHEASRLDDLAIVLCYPTSRAAVLDGTTKDFLLKLICACESLASLNIVVTLGEVPSAPLVLKHYLRSESNQFVEVSDTEAEEVLAL
ncbi:hypothetical protein EJ08DRAFT_691328 [Tothia fuscella]|uniref:Uncharacterized protein n=1 Tax=Tothia fuscella TaxID=1048955 RepID=A0A9P4P5M4_9PEZI|nr:hypothetical protein EJ08DRAFT_691328 [Tothia fuscella]